MRSAQFRYEARVPQYCWSSGSPSHPLCGRVLLRTSRPLFAIPPEFVDRFSTFHFTCADLDQSLRQVPARTDSTPLPTEDLEYLESIYMAVYQTHSRPGKVSVPPPLVVVDTGQESHKLKEYAQAFCKYQFMDLDYEKIRVHVDDLCALITEMPFTTDFMRDDRLKRWYPLASSHSACFLLCNSSFLGLASLAILSSTPIPW